MSGCRKSRANARAFVVAPYVIDANDRLAPAELHCCPYATDGHKCKIRKQQWRVRKTAVAHPLLVLWCVQHGHCFTIYPPGHVPYGRQRLAPIAPDGQPLGIDDSGTALWCSTLFDAALDAAYGDAWARECPGGTHLWWSSQWRRLARISSLLGVCPDLPQPLRDQLAEVLDVDGGLLNGLAADLRSGPGYQARGRAACAVLDTVDARWPTYCRLVEAGWMVGLWSRPMFPAGGGRRLIVTPFRTVSARGPPGEVAGRSSPTNLEPGDFTAMDPCLPLPATEVSDGYGQKSGDRD